MNERIRELAEQAGLRFTLLMSNPMVPIVDGKETDLEKFAEFIVRECASVVKYYYIRGGEPITPQHITRHFGVEE
jgi:hypothetical protein